MEPLHAILGFSVAAGLATITPGLDTALVLRAAAVEGPRAGMRAAVGIALGCLVWGMAVSVGLGALLAASRVAYDVVRVAGALYVVWLGARMLMAAFRKQPADVNALPAPSERSWLWRGFFTNLLNPKVGVFYLSLLPLFVPLGVNVTAFSMMLTAIHAASAIAWFSLLTTLMRPLAAWLRRGSVTCAVEGVTGSALIAFGAGLFLERR